MSSVDRSGYLLTTEIKRPVPRAYSRVRELFSRRSLSAEGLKIKEKSKNRADLHPVYLLTRGRAGYFAGAVWYAVSLNQHATYQIYTQESVSGLIADASIEFHGVEVGKVKSVRLVNSHTVGIVLSIDKTARLLQPASRRLPHEDSRHDDQSGQREFFRSSLNC
ncbi:MlaD family protein [Paraburkholderia sediminicola]|uniref:MlaD family protein n=1 Tax=Paraburkholderia sediminicola TaxID=458836 RepID=UPI0038B6D566